LVLNLPNKIKEQKVQYPALLVQPVLLPAQVLHLLGLLQFKYFGK
jgi:hypothetical protein